jgi:hypothetical protein
MARPVASPPKETVKKRPAVSPPAPQKPWMEKLTRTGYLLVAILFHLLLFIIVAGWVVFRAPPAPTEDFVKTYLPPGAPPPPPPATSVPTMPVPSAVATPTIITSPDATMPTFSVPLPNLTPDTAVTKAQTSVAPVVRSANNLAQRLSSIKTFVTEGQGRTPSNIAESNGDPHNVVAHFPVYVASYANGYWYCNTHFTSKTNGTIDAGSMPNLVAKIDEWSHGNLKGNVEPTPLDIGGPDLAEKKPPFIFFTGHKDFTLTDAEILNLRNYLQNGGAIWGDNALAGSGSRFDIAFHREMKRVVPDADKNFEPVPLTDDVYTKSWFTIDEVPSGMNYYNEPLQRLDIDGKLAIIYTPNDYSDLYFMRIQPGDAAIDELPGTPDSPLFTDPFFLKESGTFFRNFNLPACLAAQRLGMNIIGYMLVRFDKDLMLAP